ncbi:MAG: methylenetetrahydrofolate reductase C-terminal domain-containing protein, partial [Kiritimatiellota bacterium]|nr:methylenetetrahydrofolate reductase C-terminal domain-containing protein [Kiritimatiellota bacterium]
LSFGRRNEYYAFPPPERYVLGAPDPDPWPRLGATSKPFTYRIVSLLHRLMCKPDAVVYKIMRAYFRAIPDKGILYRLTHGFEEIVKRLLFDCRDCGDCALPDMAYCCPMSKCAKEQRNGPCGGSLDGMCEVYPDDRRCVWTCVYERLKSSGDLEPHLPLYVPPRNAQLEDTSGWANFYLGRDHSRQPKAKEKS